MNKASNMYEDWARFTIDRWQQKVRQLRVTDTTELLKSFQSHITLSASGTPEKIVFTYLYYGIFPEMGVGKGVPLNEVDGSNRTKKPWYSQVFFKEVAKLGALVADKYGAQAVAAIKVIENITEQLKQS